MKPDEEYPIPVSLKLWSIFLLILITSITILFTMGTPYRHKTVATIKAGDTEGTIKLLLDPVFSDLECLRNGAGLQIVSNGSRQELIEGNVKSVKPDPGACIVEVIVHGMDTHSIAGLYMQKSGCTIFLPPQSLYEIMF